MICTFYSFKGGVGRSMALANVAEQFYADGLSVLMVDFDLEAPGLERYFADRLPTDLTLQKVLEQRGVLDLIVSYKELRALASSAPAVTSLELSLEDRIRALPVEPLREFIIDIVPRTEKTGPSISLMTAGRRAGDRFKTYARDVLNFNWEDFYANADGELFFEWFRLETERHSDVVLLDSRTGITEMSGVCTYHLADLVVSCVAANHQNQEGTLRLATSLANDDLIRTGRKGRRLNQIFVPSRVEISEGERVKEFESRFGKLIDEAFPQGVPGQNSLSFDLAIPYVPYFAFDEKVAVREASHPLAKLLTEPVARLAAVIARNSEIGTPLYRAYHTGAEADARLTEDLFKRSSEEVQLQIRRLFSRLVYVYPNSPTSVATAYVMDLPTATRPLVDELLKLRLLRAERDSVARQFIQLRDDSLLKAWPRIQEWASTDRNFLFWRQGLAPKLATWDGSKGPADLLSGTALNEASEWAKSRPDDLSDRERDFIEQSVRNSEGFTRPTALSPASILIHPFKNERNDNAILFVHGFAGDAERTWGRFPTFLLDNSGTKQWDAFGLGFPTSMSLDSVGLWNGDTPISLLAAAFGQVFQQAPLDKYLRIALLAHSLGGLVVQRALLDVESLTGRVSHVFLFGTPSAGLRRASPFSFWKRQSRDLTQQSPFIETLRKDWSARFASIPFKCYAIAPASDEFVPASSSIGPFRPDQTFVVPGSHSSVVKPSSPDDPSVKLVTNAMGGYAAVPDVVNQARVAIEGRNSRLGVDLLWPIRFELDRNALSLLALALDELGRTEEAVALLQTQSKGTSDALAALAGRYKRRWLAESRRSDAERALRLYEDAMKTALSKGNHDIASYAANNVMFMKLAYGSDLDEARQAAAISLESSTQMPEDVWSRGVQGDALMVLGKSVEALRKYQESANLVPSPAAAESIYRQAVRIADLLNDEEVAKALPVIFRGPDAPAA